MHDPIKNKLANAVNKILYARYSLRYPGTGAEALCCLFIYQQYKQPRHPPPTDVAAAADADDEEEERGDDRIF